MVDQWGWLQVDKQPLFTSDSKWLIFKGESNNHAKIGRWCCYLILNDEWWKLMVSWLINGYKWFWIVVHSLMVASDGLWGLVMVYDGHDGQRWSMMLNTVQWWLMYVNVNWIWSLISSYHSWFMILGDFQSYSTGGSGPSNGWSHLLDSNSSHLIRTLSVSRSWPAGRVSTYCYPTPRSAYREYP